jgi:hypothetical protein
MIRAFVVAVAVAVMTLWGTAVALAKPRVAIVAFDGDSQGALQDVVIELLEGDVSLVGPRQVTKAMDKLELDSDMSGKQLKKLAKELEADSIIRGELSGGKGSRKILHVLLFVNGKRVKGFKVEFGSAKSEKFKTALHAKLLEKLGLESAGAGADEEVAEPPKKKKKKKGDDEEGEGAAASSGDNEPAEKPKKKKKKKGDDEEGGDEAASGDDDEDPNAGTKKTATGGDGDEGDDDEEAGDITINTNEPEPMAGRSANRAAVRVDVGPSLSTRSLTFTSRAFEEAPQPYSNPAVPGFRVEGELYPLAFSKPHSFLGGLGIGAELDQTLSLNLTSTVQMGTKFPAAQKHFSVGGRLRIVFGHKVTSPGVTLAGGYTSRSFTVDRSKLVDGNIIDLPDVGYKGYNAGIALRFPVMAKVAIIAAGRGIFVTTTGAIQTAAQYGQAKVTGAEGTFGVDINIAKRIAVRVIGEVTQMGFAFTGTGQMSNNRDGDPSTKDVGGAADRYIGAALTLGVSY